MHTGTGWLTSVDHPQSGNSSRKKREEKQVNWQEILLLISVRMVVLYVILIDDIGTGVVIVTSNDWYK